MTKASDNIFPKLIGAEGAAPGTPGAATAILYVKADGLWYSKDDAGVETLVSGGSGGGIPATIFDAKGDLIAASAADTAVRLAVGTNYKRLVADSAQSTGLAWLGLIGARAYNATAQTVTAATETTVLYDSEEYDTSAIHDVASNTGRFAVPTGMGGYWRFTSHVSIIGTHGIVYFYLRKDGTTAIIGTEIDVATATTDFSGIVSCVVNLAAAQYVETRAYRATGTTFGNNLNATMCSMEAEFLGV